MLLRMITVLAILFCAGRVHAMPIGESDIIEVNGQ